MATKADRGTKRTCQDASCGLRFYDLARDPITCPTCEAAYKIIVMPPAAIRKPYKKFDHSVKASAPIEPEKEAEDDIVVADDTDGEVHDAIILEDEEEDGDVSGIVEGPAKEEI
ncbi:MAG: FYDLN acid domain-containing protein [Hyphomicrobiaceae bacterium]